MNWQIIQAHTGSYLDHVRALFIEYADSLEVDLCFQNFNQELATLPGSYAPSDGRVLLATKDEQVAGCVALRKFADDTCEMKRLYVRPAWRGQQVGRVLATAIIAEARTIGYTRMLLDTLPTMHAAISLYRSLGFTTSDPYRYNPVDGVVFMELTLR